MLDHIRDLIARTRTDEAFKQRVRQHDEQRRDKLRPLRRKFSRQYRQRPVNATRLAARRAVREALQTGRLQRGPCAQHDGMCYGRIEAHHANGYDHPLDVIWLCKQHHARIHGRTPPASPY